MPLGELARRLADCMRAEQDLPLPERHRSLDRLLDSIWEECPPPERLLWAVTATFVSGAGLDALTAAASGAGLTTSEALAALAGLVDKSILTPTQGPAHAPIRYRLPNTLRSHALRHLPGGSPQIRAASTARTRWYLHWAHRLGEQWESAEQARNLAESRAEEADAGATIEALLAEGEARDALELALGLWPYRMANGAARKGLRQIRDAHRACAQLPRTDRLPVGDRIAAHQAVGYLALASGDLDTSVLHLRTAERLALAVDDRTGVIRSRAVLGMALMFRSDSGEVDAVLHRAVREAAALGDQWCQARSQGHLGAVALFRGRFAEAEHHFTAAHRLSEGSGERWYTSYLEWGMGLCRAKQRDAPSAVRLLCRAVRTKHELGDSSSTAVAIDALAWMEMQQGQAPQVARLLGASDRISPADTLSFHGLPQILARRRQCLEWARIRLGQERFERLSDALRHQAPDDIIRAVLTHYGDHPGDREYSMDGTEIDGRGAPGTW